MKLNPDCIRDILLYVESETDLDTFVEMAPESIPSGLSIYSFSELAYHVKQAELSGLLKVLSWYLDGSFLIEYLLPPGHQFLSDIREDTNWNKTKEIAKSVGSNSLDVMKDIASGVIATLIQSALHGGQ